MGTIRKVKRRNGTAWEWRYREGPDQKQRQKTFSVQEFPTEKALRRHLTTLIEILNPPALRTFQRSTRGNASQGKSRRPLQYPLQCIFEGMRERAK
jgi:hypothetical protein